MYVCICNGVTERQIREAAASGCRSVAELTMRTGAGANCGTCLDTAAAMLDELSQGDGGQRFPILNLSRAA